MCLDHKLLTAIINGSPCFATDLFCYRLWQIVLNVCTNNEHTNNFRGFFFFFSSCNVNKKNVSVIFLTPSHISMLLLQKFVQNEWLKKSDPNTRGSCCELIECKNENITCHYIIRDYSDSKSNKNTSKTNNLFVVSMKSIYGEWAMSIWIRWTWVNWRIYSHLAFSHSLSHILRFTLPPSTYHILNVQYWNWHTQNVCD